MVFFSLGDDGEVDTNKVFQDSDELAKFIDKIIDNNDNNPSINYTSNIYIYFRNFKRVNRSEKVRSANELNNILEHGCVNCFIPSGNGCFLQYFNSIFKKTLAWSISKSYNHIQEELMLLPVVEYQIL